MLDGSGYAVLTPKRETKVYITNNDPAFADQVLGHNETCAKQLGCKKAQN